MNDRSQYANDYDRAVAGTYERREADWRQGAVVYQIFPDRFAPAADLEAKRHLYPAPKRLRAWDELPTRGTYLPEQHLWSQEIDFWGGDLASTRARLDYVESLGADVVYLNPIHLSHTNHRYDAIDYAEVSPEYGSRADVRALADDAHARGLRLMLDGVFNHMGRNATAFREAEADPASPYRAWFGFGEQFATGVRCWADAENLPELNLENPAVRRHIVDVVRGYLDDGVDGWRLDVAFDIGMAYLDEITRAAHAAKPGSVVIGEIAAFPKEWFPSVDGLIGFTMRRLLLDLARGAIGGQQARRAFGRFYDECDYEHLLMSWVYLDNHDTPRLAHVLPDEAERRLATVLMHTLPGSANVYYGSELGMAGGDDPANRAPMRWDLVSDSNPWLTLTRRLIGLRHTHRALRVGDLRWAETERLLGFERHTDRVRDAVIVLVNPTSDTVREQVLVPDSKLVAEPMLVDLLGGPDVQIVWGVIDAELPPHGCVVLAPAPAPSDRYDSFKRVQ